MKFHIYHIPGQKIGVTTNLQRRVESAQGFSSSEYEVLESSDDIKYVTRRELELQVKYGYSVDRTPYAEYIKRFEKDSKTKEMDINVTAQTTTFPCSVDDLELYLLKIRDNEWDTPLDGKLCVCSQADIDWVVKNSMTSTYRTSRCFVYNKAFAKYRNHSEANCDQARPNGQACKTTFDLIRDWARERGIYDKGNSSTQFVKLIEESGELARGILKKDQPEVIDAIGDMVVVLTNLAELEGLRIEDCIDSAYEVISSRTGKMVNGTFVKDV